jgi:hypothetical protein
MPPPWGWRWLAYIVEELPAEGLVREDGGERFVDLF